MDESQLRQKEQTVLFSGYWRTMGFGLPAAMAAKLIKPEKQVVAIVGDGGLQMVLADLLTATRYELNYYSRCLKKMRACKWREINSKLRIRKR